MEKFNALCWYQKHKTESRLVHQEGTVLFLKSTSWISLVFMHFASLWVWHHYSCALLKFCSKCLLIGHNILGLLFLLHRVHKEARRMLLSHGHCTFRFPESSHGNAHRSVYKSESVFENMSKMRQLLKDQGEDLQLKPNRHMPMKYVFFKNLT